MQLEHAFVHTHLNTCESSALSLHQAGFLTFHHFLRFLRHTSHSTLSLVHAQVAPPFGMRIYKAHLTSRKKNNALCTYPACPHVQSRVFPKPGRKVVLDNPPDTSELERTDSTAARWRKPGDRARRTLSARCSWEQEELQIYMGFQPPPCPTSSNKNAEGRQHACLEPTRSHSRPSPPPHLAALIRAAAGFLPFGKKNPDSMFLYSGNLVKEYPLASKKWQAELI